MSNKTAQKYFKKRKKNQAGFSLVEAVFAIFILTIGLIGTAAAITYALEIGARSGNISNAKLMVVASIEEIEALRNSRRLDFKQIANVGAVDNQGTPSFFGGFSTGLKEVSLNPGPDGVNGTADDLLDAGPDGTYGTNDDFDNPALARGGYSREITITNLNDTLKKIEVRVRYLGVGGKVGDISGVCYLNDEARVTR